MAKTITYEQHIKKHTRKENTYDSNCPYCNPEYSRLTIEERLKKMAGF
jgi:hypothetical protein